MLYYAVVFIVVALLAAWLGFGALAGLAATIAKVLAVLFLLLFVLSLARRKGVRMRAPADKRVQTSRRQRRQLGPLSGLSWFCHAVKF